VTFLAFFCAMWLEHYRPLVRPLPPYQWYDRFIGLVERNVNAGEHKHGMLGWLFAVGPLALAAWLLHALLGALGGGLGSLLAWAFSVAVLYLTLGFKYYSNHVGSIARALREDDLPRARATLAQWRDKPAEAWTAADIARLTVEKTFESAHRQMFAPVFWFVLLSGFGPVGPVLYRASSILAARWSSAEGDFGAAARRMFDLLNWLPARLAAASFAIVGNFEDAMVCWRGQSGGWRDASEGAVLAAGCGALGVRLESGADGTSLRPELGVGDPPEADDLESAVSMIWRALILWLALGLMMAVSGWLG
jgi:adenosylcobinamide-phosphate synthase